MNIKAFKKTCCLGLMLMLTTNVFAGGSTWYRDCEVKLSSPSSAKGVVYVKPYYSWRKTALLIIIFSNPSSCFLQPELRQCQSAILLHSPSHPFSTPTTQF